MIEYIEGDIFQSPAQVIVNTVNTVGVMGKGLALSFKKRYPEMFNVYRNACERHQLTIGKLMLFYAPDHWILMFPTKENWRNPSKLEYIEAGLKKFVNTYAEKGITSIAFPKLGCGNGELPWETVKQIMERYLKPLPITIYIYVGMEPSKKPEHTMQEETMDWLRANARDMSFNGLCDDFKHSSAILPIQLDMGNEKWSVSWEDGLNFVCGETRTHMSEDEMYQMWDDMRHQGIIVTEGDNEKMQMFCHLLMSKGYLSPIRVMDEQIMRSFGGYQVNMGYGRMYTMRGDA